MAEPGAAADGGRDAGFPDLSLSTRPPLLLSFSVELNRLTAVVSAALVPPSTNSTITTATRL
jgi:hypothetical protein